MQLLRQHIQQANIYVSHANVVVYVFIRQNNLLSSCEQVEMSKPISELIKYIFYSVLLLNYLTLKSLIGYQFIICSVKQDIIRV